MSTNFLARDQKSVWHPFDIFQNVENIFIERSKGINLYTSDGRNIKDMVSSWWTNLHGHNHPHIVSAIQRQAEVLSHAIFSGFTHEPAIRLAERLLEILPNKMEKIFYSDNGSTAVEVGLKIAIQHWHNLGDKKTKILAFEGCYHGDTFGAMSLAGPEPFNQPFAPHLFQVTYLPFPNAVNWQQVENILQTELSTGQYAAIVYEPMIQGVGGMRLFDCNLQDSVLDTCKKNNVLLVADEVMTGFGRTGKLFASEYLKTKPDIVCMSKGITGGFLPLGATAITQNVYKVFVSSDKKKLFLHGHSYTGNPLACAAANASLDLLLNVFCMQQLQAISTWQASFAESLRGHSSLEWANSLGTILTINLVPKEKQGYFDSRAEQAYKFFIDRNLLLRPMGNVVYLSPPYCATENDMSEAYDAILAYLEK
ncbi:MAG TPA: adenosylmethionine--8-amino-7-oxononanoate transaminase [Cytophagales bacterium]|nr:adenosylmethionine--8-amino-7-oxononanoate transaminase [Cytophagales bacterium]